MTLAPSRVDPPLPHLLCGFGLFVTRIPWTIIGLVRADILAWMVVLDVVKRSVYRWEQCTR